MIFIISALFLALHGLFPLSEQLDIVDCYDIYSKPVSTSFAVSSMLFAVVLWYWSDS